ncbi:MAG: ABC transporter ATP-binding protein [Planctomycetaceae bacterium]
MPLTKENLRELWQLFAYLQPYRGRFLAAWCCLLISSGTGLAMPWLGGRLIDSAQGLGTWSLGTLGVILASVLFLRAACAFGNTVWSTDVGERTMADLRMATFGRLLRLPMVFFAQRRVGELASRLTADLDQIQRTLVSSIPQFLSQFLTLLGGIVLTTMTSPRLTLLVLATTPVVVGTAVWFGRRARQLSRETQDRLAETNIVVEESLQGISSVKAFGREAWEGARYRSGQQRVIDAALFSARHQGTFSAFMTLFGTGSMAIVFWFGCGMIRQGQLSVGEMTQFLLYAMFIAGSAGQFARLYGDLQRMLGATQRVRELLREPLEPGQTWEPGRGADVPPQAEVGTNVERGARPSRCRGEVALEGVQFAYPSRREVPVLRDFTLRIGSGQRVALVGASGAGKSTVTALLMRFYQPDGGRILLDGRDVGEYPLEWFRAQFAIVPQDVLLFGGTIRENIAYGRLGATAAEIEEAARKANAHEFIDRFPERYETIVGERGVKLSGGQRQRIAIARAVLRDPALLLLDEATSSLDSESEGEVQRALDQLMQGRTSIIIAHRLSTIRDADCIYVLKDGGICEAGTHDQLLASPAGVYRAFCERQFGSEAIAASSGGAPVTDW